MNDPLRQHHFLLMEIEFGTCFRAVEFLEIPGDEILIFSPNPPQLSGFLVPTASSAWLFTKSVYQGSHLDQIILLHALWRNLRATPIDQVCNDSTLTYDAERMKRQTLQKSLTRSRGKHRLTTIESNLTFLFFPTRDSLFYPSKTVEPRLDPSNICCFHVELVRRSLANTSTRHFVRRK